MVKDTRGETLETKIRKVTKQIIRNTVRTDYKKACMNGGPKERLEQEYFATLNDCDVRGECLGMVYAYFNKHDVPTILPKVKIIEKYPTLSTLYAPKTNKEFVKAIKHRWFRVVDAGYGNKLEVYYFARPKKGN